MNKNTDLTAQFAAIENAAQMVASSEEPLTAGCAVVAAGCAVRQPLQAGCAAPAGSLLAGCAVRPPLQAGCAAPTASLLAGCIDGAGIRQAKK